MPTLPIAVGTDGARAVLLTEAPFADHVELQLDTGQRVRVPASLLSRQADGTYRLALSRDELLSPISSKSDKNVAQVTQSVTLPVVEERVTVGKREIETGRVAVHVTPQVRREVIDVPVTDQTLEVQRVPVGRFVEAAEPAREEGDVTIVPVYEEVVVVERRLMLKEEIHIHRKRTQRHERHEIELRSEEAHVLRTNPDAPPSGAPARARGDQIGRD
ncbi:MAG TPA: YsnF/AvaK domain-containing protein [Tepidisphaeraceae bacterium]|nr:YsnF/AvaK domain-containing protein [Tepidisphaeraceae bacterium]